MHHLVSPTPPADQELPEFVRELLWDYANQRLTWHSARDLIIRRVLSEGSWPAVSWLRRRLGDTGIRRWIVEHDGRPLDPQQLCFWQVTVGLPPELVQRWLQDEPRRIWWERAR